MTESIHLRWFEEFPKCPCGKTARGILRGDQNQSYGHHCLPCAKKRLRDSEKARAAIAKAKGRE
jgi:hypothetical protein